MSSEPIKEPQPSNDFNTVDNIEHQHKDEEIKIVKPQINLNIPFDNLVEIYSNLIGLHGSSYEIGNIMVFYTILSNQLKHNFLIVDKKQKIDLRIPLIIILKAGHGKKNYVYFIRKTVKGLEKEYIEPTSFHPEQFLGKVVEQKVKGHVEYLKIMGSLNCDFLLIDDAHLLINNQKMEYQEALKHIRTALDPIGYNSIEKKQVNVPFKERLQYYPECNIVLMSQPINELAEDLVNRGTLRRFNTLYLRIPEHEHDQSIYDIDIDIGVTDIDSEYTILQKNWIEFNKSLMTRKLKPINENDVSIIKTTVNDYLASILEDIRKTSSLESKEYANTDKANIKYLIYKMASVRALCEDIPVNIGHINDSITDHKGIWKGQIAWISQQMEMTESKPKGWKDNVHGWVLEKLYKDGDHYKSELFDRYCRKFENTYAPNTLKQYVNDGLKKLKKWEFIEEFVYDTEANDRKFKITNNGTEMYESIGE